MDAWGGLGRNGAVFPPRLVASVLKVIKRKVLDQRVVLAVELESGGPTAELPELWNQPDYQEYWDDVNGGFLDPRLVHEARLLELDWIKKERVYDYRSRTEAEEKGIKPIPLIWVDTNKGDKNTPFVRSRICVRECKKGQNAVESLEPEKLFSAMPPLEALKLLIEIAVFSEGVHENFSQWQAFEASSEGFCRYAVAFHVWHARRIKLVAGRLHRDIGPARLQAWPVQPCNVPLSSGRWPHAGAW